MPTFTPIDDASELCRLGVHELGTLFANKSLSPVEVARSALDRADQINPRLNAFTFLDREGAMDSAKASEARWRRGEPLSPIDGIPTTVKDFVWVKGWSVRYGSLTTPFEPMCEDAPAVGRLRAAGAVLIGQTTTPEFGWKGVTDSALAGITRNPWDARMTPGGSSGGAAVAAAVGAGVLHLGTDGGGSIRIPASLTGTAGLKPSFGRVAAYPPSPFGTLAHIGPMTRRASDLQPMLQAMIGRDMRDWYQGAAGVGDLDNHSKRTGSVRVGYWTKSSFGTVGSAIAALMSGVVERLAKAGVETEPVTLPDLDLFAIFENHWLAGAAARLSTVPEGSRDQVDPGFVRLAKRGAAVPAVALALAQAQRAEFGRQMDQLLSRFDFLISPATPHAAFEVGAEDPSDTESARWWELTGFTFPMNLSQQPACVIPMGQTPSGLPAGLQIVGARGDDANVLSVAVGWENLLAQANQENEQSRP